MAKSISKKKVKKAAPRVGRLVAKLQALKGYGEEPSFDKEDFLTPTEASKAFNWYNNTQEDDDAKEFLLAFLDDMGEYELKARLDRIEPKFVFGYASVAAWTARLLNLGYSFEGHKERIAYVYERLNYTIEAVRKLKAENAKRVFGRSEYFQYSDKTVQVLNEIEDAIDIFHVGTYDYDFNAYAALEKRKLHDYTARKMADFLEDEYTDVFDPPEDDSGTIPPKEPKQKLKLLRQIVADCRDYASDNFVDRSRPEKLKIIDPETGEVRTRKPRKKKPVSVEKKLSRLHYMKDYDEYSLVSINPEKIIGAEQLWVFNTRYDMLQVYNAETDAGLDIKGSTILNYDPSISVGKRCGRLAIKMLDMVKGGTKGALGKVMKEVTAVEVPANGRLNEHCILVRAI